MKTGHILRLRMERLLAAGPTKIPVQIAWLYPCQSWAICIIVTISPPGEPILEFLSFPAGLREDRVQLAAAQLVPYSANLLQKQLPDRFSCALFRMPAQTHPARTFSNTDGVLARRSITMPGLSMPILIRSFLSGSRSSSSRIPATNQPQWPISDRMSLCFRMIPGGGIFSVVRKLTRTNVNRHAVEISSA